MWKELKMDKCREEFELWINRETGLFLHRTNFPMTRNEDQQYYDHSTNLAWFSWQASRESMKAIKFPEELTPEYEGDGYKSRYEEAYCKGYNQALRDCEKQIISAGYKVE